jgi:hypothetical protein
MKQQTDPGAYYDTDAPAVVIRSLAVNDPQSLLSRGAGPPASAEPPSASRTWSASTCQRSCPRHSSSEPTPRYRGRSAGHLQPRTARLRRRCTYRRVDHQGCGDDHRGSAGCPKRCRRWRSKPRTRSPSRARARARASPTTPTMLGRASWAQARAVLDEMIEEAGGIPDEDRRRARSVLGLGEDDST